MFFFLISFFLFLSFPAIAGNPSNEEIEHVQRYLHEKLIEDASNGDADAQFMLGLRSLYNDQQFNLKDAFNYFYKAAVQGHADAQFQLAGMYFNGSYIKQDMEQAVYWYEKSAAQNQPGAQFFYGLMYRNGEGVDRDYKKAWHLIEKAANQDYPDANYVLGLMYLNGEGRKRDIENAKFFLKKAAKMDHANAIKKLDELNNRP